MKKRKALITGASSGIGKAIVSELLTSKNYEIIGIARTISKTTFSQNDNFYPYEMDFKNPSFLPKLTMLATKHSDIDTLILSAGAGLFKNLEEFSFSEIKQLMDINFLSCVYICKIFLPLLKKQAKANVIFIGSTAGLKGKKQGSIYCASKFAIRGFAQALREESPASLKISTIQPDMVRTPFYDNLHFHPKEGDSYAINPMEIARTTKLILESDAVFDEIVLSPPKKAITRKKTSIF